MKLKIKNISTIIVFGLLISASISASAKGNISTIEQEIKSSSINDINDGEYNAAQNITANDVVQNKGFAHLVVDSSIATITAGFSHPEDLYDKVRIEWSLFAWNAGEEKDPIRMNQRVEEFNHVELSIQYPVGEYDYYLLVCKDMIQNEEGIWIPILTTESRYSRLAPFNGIGERTGEVTSSSAVLHTYLTERPRFEATDPDSLRVPPMAGFAQFVVYQDPEMHEKVAESGFYPVDDYIQVDGNWHRTNYNFRWTVSDLEAGKEYYYLLETKSSDNSVSNRTSNLNSFKTAPQMDSSQPISFVVTHCLDPYNTAYSDPVEGVQYGLKVFASMLSYDEHLPDFMIMQGDTVYYDGGGWAPDVGDYLNSEFIRRWLYWYAQYQYENFMNFFQVVPGYWMVDDHDYWQNNINVNMPDGWYIFRNTNPTPGNYGTVGEDAVSYYNDNPYATSKGDGSKYWRSIRWGQHLEIFLEEGRNLRDEDANLIWGDEQREWLEKQILASTATFKIIATTTPLLGPVVPDDVYPTVIPDKHANDKFRSETEQFLNNIREVENVYLVAGDRHYKYHSIINGENYPDLSNFQEFGSGSGAAPPHAILGGVPDSDFASKLFSDEDVGAASAGYLRVDIIPQQNGAEISFKLISVTAEVDNDIVYQQSFTSISPTPNIPVETYLPIVTVHQ